MRRSNRFVAAALCAAGLVSGPAWAAAQDPIRVLYLEAEPRFEYKFIRRAVEDDRGILLGSILYAAEDEQQPGPSAVSAQDVSRDSLASLDVLVLGSLQRSAFSEQQLEAIVAWVESGGRLLLLGGRDALANAGWQDSPLDPLLPIEPTSRVDVVAEVGSMPSVDDSAAAEPDDGDPMDRMRRQPMRRMEQQQRVDVEVLEREQERLQREMESLRRAEAQGPVPVSARPSDPSNARARIRSNGSRHFRVEPEPSELDHPFFDFEEGPDAFFETLPELFAHQLEALPRAEATVLLRDRDDPTFTVLAYAERGDGLCAVLTAIDTWRWRMHADLPVDDRRHDRFWQRLIRWLGSAR